MCRMRVLVALMLMAFSHPGMAELRPRIAVFTVADTPFWTLVSRFAEAAGDSLNADVDVFNLQLNRVRFRELMDEVISDETSGYDALVFPNFLKTAAGALKTCELNRIVCVLYNGDLEDNERRTLGKPGQHLQYWAAHLVPGDANASETMTQILVQSAREQRPQGALQMFGVNGYRFDQPAVDRAAGLNRVLAADPGLHMHQVVYTDWSEDDAHFRTQRLLERYPETRIIWSGNYRSTSGVLRALHEAGWVPGKDVKVNSFGFGGSAMEELAGGEIEVTAGGHFMEGAWSVVVAYDAVMASKGAKSLEYYDLKTPLLIVTRENLAKVRRVMSLLEQQPDRLRRVDFARYSRVRGNQDGPHEFSAMDVFDALDEYEASAESSPVIAR
ncbi:substrate-binding domain-containing protein [Marinobacter salinexigens]|uniref:Substrate-binding domain-containing protein n=1 Tax=Marinobacter salinexigens TaxID=2919747 RepID=A0A5B0VNN1_9GAMM|nr:ABC transporter substrate-binding protein [Marinobacter salinexigens]KAA1176236.1 substrate-binding domain-containing protein [Marinobacter salinexigens]